MQKQTFRRLMWQFFCLYLGLGLFGMFIITLDNIFIGGYSFDYLLKFNLKAVTVQVITLVVLFQTITLLRLGLLRNYWSRPDGIDLKAVWKRLIKFPGEMFWGMVIFGLISGPLFHLANLRTAGRKLNDLDMKYLWALMKSLLFEQTLVLILAILIFTMIRRLLRPIIINLPSESLKELSGGTFLKPLAVCFTSLMLITILSPAMYVFRMLSEGKVINPWLMLSIAGFALFFGITIFLLLVWQFRDELQVFIRGMLSLLEGDRAWLHRRVPIISQDEIGRLGIAFNQLQEHIATEYENVQREMQLAFKVQQRLLPQTHHQMGNYHVAAMCEPVKEVGGDFFDIIQLNEERFAVVIGDVSGHGMPAALIMSAMLVLLRTEIRRGGTAGEVLTRLNHVAVDTLQGDMSVTLGIGIFDKQKNTCEYAGAGHMFPYLLQGIKVTEISCPSLPLGIAKEEVYSQVITPFKNWDMVVFYTDGVVEALNEQGEMLGFRGFERCLSDLDKTTIVERQLGTLVKRLPKSRENTDDRTIVIVQYRADAKEQVS